MGGEEVEVQCWERRVKAGTAKGGRGSAQGRSHTLAHGPDHFKTSSVLDQ